ncbi:MAG TPA: DUF1549 domain-containing protein, partial [Tepidisphaeraceae bacterium]|nr:DUF1549 domain-containing protein [Tepidisphaeraceae bacterium]
MPMYKACVAILALALLVASPARGADPNGLDAQYFEMKIRPLLVERCFKCHSTNAAKLKGGLYADSLGGLLKGGDDGPAVIPGHPEQSRLIEAIGYQNPDLQMPPKGKLPAEQILDLTRWITMGVPWPKSDAGPVAPTNGGIKHFDLQQRKATHWAWRPIRAQTPPAVRDRAWPATPIDPFVLVKLEAAGLKPAPEAGKRSLLRRAYFDLIGLPPKPAEVDAFVADTSPDAFAKVVDRLLANPHFGERWARHWMDLVRYAETYGHEFDYPIANAWQYRDYLIRAFNADLPYDQFVREQIAGDLLPHPRLNPTDGFNESALGTGWWNFGEQMQAPVDVRQYQADRIDNQIDVFGKTFLGLTVACARCHDHKFDAIAQKDYYSLFGVIESTHRQDLLLDPHAKIQQGVRELSRLRGEAHAALAAALPSSASTKEDFAHCLAVACEIIADKADVKKAAQDAGLDSARLNRWVTALHDPAIKGPTHPLFACSLFTETSGPSSQAARQRALDRWQEQRKKADDSAAKSVVFKNFADGAYGDWRATGWAFGQGPTGGGECDVSGPLPRVAMPGIAQSGALAGKLRGVLRSPTFAITKPQILYHLAGHGGRVHLIINDFMMDSFNGLLFAGASFNVDTGGKWAWHRQAQDVSRYVGHSAYIEIIDDGDGEIAVDQIRFADNDSPEPVAAPSELAHNLLLADAGTASAESLAAGYGAAWAGAAARWRDGNASADDCALLNWVLDHDLMPLDSSAQAKLADCAHKIQTIAATIPAPTYAQGVTDGA